MGHFSRYSKWNLKRQLVFSLAALGLIPLLVLLLIIVPLTRQMTLDQARHDLSRRAEVLSLGTGMVLDEASYVINQLAANPTVQEAFDSTTALNKCKSILRDRATKSDGRFLAFSLLQPDGEQFFSVGDEFYIRQPNQKLRFDTVIARTELQIGEIRQGASPGSFVIDIAAPIIRGHDDRLVGFLSGTYDAFRVAAQAIKVQVGKDGLAALLTHSGKLFYARGALEQLSTHPDLRIPPPNPRFAAATTGPLFADDDRDFLISIASVHGSRFAEDAAKRVPFSIAVARPKSSALAEANQNSRLLFLSGLVVIFVVSLGAAFLAQRISRPLQLLSAKVRDFAASTAETESALPQEFVDLRRSNELEVLHASFDAMSERVTEQQSKLRQRNDEMENMVARLQQADALKNEFLSFFTHELRTPLSAIRSFAELLRITPDIEDEERLEFLSIIESECERLSRLSNDLLDLAKIESGDMPWRDEFLDATEVLEAAVKTLTVLAEKENVHLMLHNDPDLPPLFADRDRITQLATNLIANALKFTPEDGQVTVRAKETTLDGQPAVEFLFQDTGPGIPHDYLDRIFERYVQAPDGSKQATQGTGLGLAICKRVVDHYDGAIGAENCSRGGAILRVVLPAARVAEQSVSEHEASAEPTLQQS